MSNYNKLIKTIYNYCGPATSEYKDVMLWENVKNIGVFPSVFDRIMVKKHGTNLFTFTKIYLTNKEYSRLLPISKIFMYDRESNYLIIKSNNFVKNINLLYILINSISNEKHNTDITNDVKQKIKVIAQKLLKNYKNIKNDYIIKRKIQYTKFLNMEPFSNEIKQQYNIENFNNEKDPDPWYTSNNPLDIALNENIENNLYNIHQSSQLLQTDRLKSLYYYDSDNRSYIDNNKMLSISDKKLKSREHLVNPYKRIKKEYTESPRDVRHALGKVVLTKNYGSIIDEGRRLYTATDQQRPFAKIVKQSFGPF